MVAPDHELDDFHDGRAFDWSLIDRTILLHPLVVRAVGAAVVMIVLGVWPDRTSIVLTRLVGIGLAWAAATSAATALRAHRRDVGALLTAAGVGIVGLYLVVSASRRPELLGRVLAVIVLGAAARLLLGLRAHRGPRRGILLRVAALMAGGVALLAYPDSLLTPIAVGACLAWVLVGAAAISVTLNPDTPSANSYHSTHEMLDAWFDDRPKRADSRQALYDKILIEGNETGRRVIRFVMLMTFASVIASMGVITDSTAVVIGAMLIAPLMTPLMGMAISLVMGWPRRLARSAAVAGLGIVIAVAIGLMLGLLVPAAIDTSANVQILARSSPTTLDLIIAVAAGAAGAYALSRPDVSDSLPGVAIAISLVPPLAVVGISYSQGDWEAGNGALLLYGTNMLAILIVGGITFIATGVTPLSRVADNQRRLRTWGLTLAGVTVAVVGALLLNGAQVARDAFAADQLNQVVDAWISVAPEHRVVQSGIDDGTITVVIVGPSDGAPTALALAQRASIEFTEMITADVRLVVEEREVATAGG
ncbi:MAG: DUF389 domain-containing protein [Actinomycetota bacterium]